MTYLCLIYQSPEPMTAAEQQAEYAAYGAFSQEAHASGKMTGGEGLQPIETATTVRVRDGKRLITDGPFAETKEWLSGFYAFDCASLDEALDWAAKIPGAKYGSIEVRPALVM
jgi:hypothetical protein